MLWKESLRIGVDVVDEQHKELFRRTDELMKAIYVSGAEQKQTCMDTVHFLKDYASKHFADEEAYQKSIKYKGFDAHKALHEKFVRTVLEHEKKMTESDFAPKDVKLFIGMLVAWLLYHISDADQKYVKEPPQAEASRGHSDIICDSVFDVLHKMAGFDTSSMKKLESHAGPDSALLEEPCVVEVELVGDISGYIDFVYPFSFIRNFINSIMGFTPEVIDELEISALYEVSNIISGTVCRHITKEKNIFCDIKTPNMIIRRESGPDENFTLDTGKGILEVDIEIIYK